MAVKLHAKVVEVLDGFKAQGLDDKAIVQAVLQSEGSEDGVLAYAEFSDILQGLANGYEAKEPPEKAILRYYDDAKHAAWDAEEVDDEYEMARERAKMSAVEFVLSELGVEIDGINGR